MEINCSKLREDYSECIKKYSNVKGEIFQRKVEEIESSQLSNYKFKEDINKKCNSSVFAECLSKKFNIVNSQEKDLKLIKYLSQTYDQKNNNISNNKMN
jgi:hypothetical protein